MSEDLYRAVTDFARDTPAWVHAFTGTGTDAGLLVFGVLFVAAWWRVRPADGRAVALALLAPVATVFGYAVSETLKSLVDEERPCRAVVGAAASIAPCPPYGDWSFPSNHSAIAGASAMALALAWRRIAWLTAPLAVVMASSRVFVGVHYPHDVAAGLVVGALAVAVFVRLLTGPAERLVEAARTGRPGALRRLVGPGPRPAPAVAVPRQRDRRTAELLEGAAGPAPVPRRTAPKRGRHRIP
ncbi:phosphatase PAP2 family protein [Streptomyces sp. MRC013]|uniref:phosphatase PAP2 family protein n=1 Tax=Streptomyces sp. MRC013 TaxID=2898276 RepID=UPI00202610E7|nr:phosphatase PAP2 family protein [Streptomyces sp. MRC013]URM90258.1 phosphatase PAP2 family protein [Streptomyces sp. MRC013]